MVFLHESRSDIPKSVIFDTIFFVEINIGFPSLKFDSAIVVYGTACVYRELYGKVTNRRKSV